MRSPGRPRSPFMPTHIEQPGSRHSKPASRKTRSSPSASAARLTRPEPGTTNAGTTARRPRDDRGRRAQILEAAVGARADEHAVDRIVGERRAGRQPHVGERALQARAPRGIGRRRAGSGTRAVIGRASSGLVPQVTVGASARRVERHLAVERRAGIGGQRPPVGERLAPQCAPWARRAGPSRYAYVVSSGATMPARAPASIDMLQTVMRSSIDIAAMAAARVLDHVAGAAAGADRRDDREDHVLGGDARAARARRP